MFAWALAASVAANGGASPSPSSALPAASPAPDYVTVVCERAPLWLFPTDANVPSRAHVPAATLGARFALVSGPRTTLASIEYYETDIAAIEPGHAGEHYWLARACALPGR